jgi:integrase
MGCIYRRGKNYWIKYFRHGKQFAESTKSDKMEVAKRILKVREGEISQGKLPSICFEKVKFDEIMNDYISDFKINKRRSLAKAERCANYLKKEFGGMSATGVNTPNIKRYIERRLSEGLANGTINRELAALKKAFNLAARCTPPKVALVPYIPMLKESNVRKGFFEHGEFIALRDVLPLHLKGFTTFGYKTGWRVSEISDLLKSQVDLDNRIARIEPGEAKNEEARTVYLDDELIEVFRNEYKRQKKLGRISRYAFTNAKGAGKIKDFRKSWANGCEDANIGKKLFHDLRRTAVRNMVRAGIPERVAMMISGHKTRSVFDRYNIVSEDDLKEAAVKSQKFTAKQDEWLQNGYNLPKNEKRLVTLSVANP